MTGYMLKISAVEKDRSFMVWNNQNGTYDVFVILENSLHDYNGIDADAVMLKMARFCESNGNVVVERTVE